MAQKKAIVSKEKNKGKMPTTSSTKPILKAVDSVYQKTDTDPSTIQHIGENFKRIRESKKESIQEIGALLRISERYLKAIETLDQDAFPEKVYTLGFVRSYAQYLGLDPHHSTAQFKTEVYMSPVSAKELSVPKPLNSAPLPTKKILWAVALALILFLSIAYVQWGTSSTTALNEEISELLTPVEEVTSVNDMAVTAPLFDQDPVDVQESSVNEFSVETGARNLE